MEEGVILYELTVLFGEQMVAFLLRRFSLNSIWKIQNAKKLKEKLDFMTIEECPMELIEATREKAKKIWPNIEHPSIRLLNRLGENNGLNFIFFIKFKEEVIGHAVIYPINKNCINKFKSRKYLSGNDFQPIDICSKFEKSSGYYLAYLISYEEKNRSCVILKIQEYFSNVFDKVKNRNIYVFGKPSSNTITFFEKYKFINTDSTLIDKYAVHYIDKTSLARIAMVN